MSPFVAFVVLGASQVDPQRWFLVPSDFTDLVAENSTHYRSMAVGEDNDAAAMERGILPNLVLGGVILRPLVNNLFWQYNRCESGLCGTLSLVFLLNGADFRRFLLLFLALTMQAVLQKIF